MGGSHWIFRSDREWTQLTIYKASFILLVVKWPNYKPLNKSEFLKKSCLMIVVLLGPNTIQHMVVIRLCLATCTSTFSRLLPLYIFIIVYKVSILGSFHSDWNIYETTRSVWSLHGSVVLVCVRVKITTRNVVRLTGSEQLGMKKTHLVWFNDGAVQRHCNSCCQ